MYIEFPQPEALFLFGTEILENLILEISDCIRNIANFQRAGGISD